MVKHFGYYRHVHVLIAQGIKLAPTFAPKNSQFFIRGIRKFEDRIIIILDSERIISIKKIDGLELDNVKQMINV